ncbi:MAG: FAD-dependent oxidoreductase [Clostridiaceae bacterium]|nr:FAD-dependent oxidoreductase [Clostridiaceae bacterium]
MDLDKLLKKGDKCITDAPSACVAACPVHMDVKSFVEEIEKGDFKKAYKVMAKKLPFTRIIGRICDHPCEDVCVRKELGGAINIAELEKVTVELGFSTNKRTLAIPRNGKTVAVIGGGVSGITAAFDLDKKGYEVTIYEKNSRLGGRLWDFEGKNLSKELIEEELEILKKGSIKIELNREIDEKELSKILEMYNAVYIGTGLWKNDINVDFKTFQVESTSLFAGGRLINKNNSIILSLSSGRRASISIDRYIQNTSITAARENEGGYKTPLKITTDDIELVPAMRKYNSQYSEEDAIIEAKRCLKCQCLQCVKACVHLQKYNVNPKKYVRQINHNETIVLGDRYANKMINSCTLCGLCGEICPEGIEVKDIIKETRESMVEREKMPVSAHDFALKDMEFSNSSYFSMIKNQPGYEKVKYVFYPGCQLPASTPEYIEKIYSYLMSNIKEGVGLMLGCCGAPADWAGRQDLMQENIRHIKNSWESMGRPTFILACSSCYSIFEKYMPEINSVSLWETMKNHKVPINNKIKENCVLNVHDACTTRYNEKIHESIRTIASELGYKIEELKFSKEKTKCCGYGGLVYFANKEQSQEFIKDRIKESSRDYLVYCSMCRDLFVSEGKRTFHILDLIYGENLEKISLRQAPTLSQRHENRALVKINLLKRFWNEEINDFTRDSGLKLIINDNIQKQMEDRLILFEDIEKVIVNAQKNRKRFLNPETMHYLTRMRISNVTYWVEYEEKDKELIIHSVYSHRMEVVEE